MIFKTRSPLKTGSFYFKVKKKKPGAQKLSSLNRPAGVLRLALAHTEARRLHLAVGTAALATDVSYLHPTP